LDDAVFLSGVLQADVRIRGRFSSGQDRLDTASVEVSRGGAAYVVPEDKEKVIRPISILFDYTKDDPAYVYERYQHRKSISTRQATAELEAVMGAKVFDNPKPVELLASLIAYVAMEDGDIVLDYFAGSGTTAAAVAVQNERDGVARRSISVNLPEPIVDAKANGFGNVAQITCERIRRALARSSAPGLRVLSLGSSAFRSGRQIEGELFDVSETTLQVAQPSDEALVAEVLLHEGVTLDQPWVRTVAGGLPVVMSGGVTVVPSISVDPRVIDAILDTRPHVVVFLEDGFAGKDALKVNTFTRCRELDITMKTV
jgi:adenine-specific DNA-methyltransferase